MEPLGWPFSFQVAVNIFSISKAVIQIIAMHCCLVQINPQDLLNTLFCSPLPYSALIIFLDISVMWILLIM